jgi:bacterioferritin-associated ferredoxin
MRPLLWLLAAQYLRSGAKVDALLDTTPAGNRATAFPHLPSFLFSPYFAKGLSLLLSVKRSVRVIDRVMELRAVGDAKLQAVSYRRDDGAEATLPVASLLLHQGVVPNVNLAMSAGIEHRWDERQLCWNPVLDAFGMTSVEGIAIAGDGAGIAGAGGRRATWSTGGHSGHPLARTGRHIPTKLSAPMLRKYTRGRTFLDVLYRPAKQFRQPRGATIVCRCEEITAQQINDTVALGCPGPNQMKSFLRCGMGPCQGRLCGLTVTELIAEARGVPPQEVGYYRLRRR